MVGHRQLGDARGPMEAEVPEARRLGARWCSTAATPPRAPAARPPRGAGRPARRPPSCLWVPTEVRRRAGAGNQAGEGASMRRSRKASAGVRHPRHLRGVASMRCWTGTARGAPHVGLGLVHERAAPAGRSAGRSWTRPSPTWRAPLAVPVQLCIERHSTDDIDKTFAPGRAMSLPCDRPRERGAARRLEAPPGRPSSPGRGEATAPPSRASGRSPAPARAPPFGRGCHAATKGSRFSCARSAISVSWSRSALTAVRRRPRHDGCPFCAAVRRPAPWRGAGGRTRRARPAVVLALCQPVPAQDGALPGHGDGRDRMAALGAHADEDAPPRPRRLRPAWRARDGGQPWLDPAVVGPRREPDWRTRGVRPKGLTSLEGARRTDPQRPMAAVSPSRHGPVDAVSDGQPPPDRLVPERVLGDVAVEHGEVLAEPVPLPHNDARSPRARRRDRARPRRSNRSACGHFGIRGACPMACPSFSIRVRCRTTGQRRATRRRMRSLAASGVQISGRFARGVQAGRRRRIERVGLPLRRRDRLHPARGLAITPRFTGGDGPRDTAMPFPVASMTPLVGLEALPAEPLQGSCGSSRPGPRAGSARSPRSPPPASGPVEVDADHASQARLPSPRRRAGAAGNTTTTDPCSRHDRASSTRRPAADTSSALVVVASACPHLRAPGAFRPGCSQPMPSPEDLGRTSAPGRSCRLPTRRRGRTAR